MFFMYFLANKSGFMVFNVNIIKVLVELKDCVIKREAFFEKWTESKQVCFFCGFFILFLFIESTKEFGWEGTLKVI